MSTLGREPARRAINAADIPDNSINASKIIDGTISAADVSSDLVTLTGSQSLTNKTLGSGVVFPAGHIIQTQGSAMTTTFSFDPDGSFVELHTDLRVTIQAASTSNKFLVHLSIQSNSPNINQIWSWRLENITTGSTLEPYGISAGSRVRQHFSSRPVAYDSNDPENIQYTLWANIPNTNSNVYNIYGRNADGGGAMEVNRSNSDNSSWGWTGVSSLIIQEIQQ